MTAEYPQGDEPLISMPALSLPALRQVVAAVAPSGCRSSSPGAHVTALCSQ
jgi:hypothetical protein